MKYTITIPEPCSEDWNLMTPTEKGKFCDSCQKEVLDFTNASTYTLAGLLDKNKKICGRFRASQLNKEFSSNNNTSLQRASLAFGITSLLSLCTPVVAQKDPKPVATLVTVGRPLIIKDSVTNSYPSMVQGIVIDQDDLPLPGATIIIQGTNMGTQTDFDGNFKLKVPEGAFESNKKLVVSYIGFETKEICLNKLEPKIKLDLTISMLEGMVGGIVVVERRNIFNRIVNLFKKKRKYEVEEPEELRCDLEDISVIEEPVFEPKTIQHSITSETTELSSKAMVWPNPATTEIKITYTMEEGGFFGVQLIPINGGINANISLVQGSRKKGEHIEILQLNTIKNGLYVLTVTTNNKVEKHKILVEKNR